MKNKKSLNFFFLIIIVIVGAALYKQIDSENLKFKQPGIAIIYSCTLLFSLYCLIKDYWNHPKNKEN